MSQNRDIRSSIFVQNSSFNNSPVTNTTADLSAHVTPEMWEQMFSLAGKHGEDGEIKKLIDLKDFLDDNKPQQAKSVWRDLKAFLSRFVQHSANVAQIIGVIDQLTR